MTTATADLAIDLERVSKTYKGRVRALRDLSMQVHRGEIFGLLGPNGAGKSTLVKILMTVVRPGVCKGRLLGRPVGHKSTLAGVGYLPEHLRFPEYLTGDQALHYVGRLCKVQRRDRVRRADELLDLVGMTAWRNKKVGSYSKGMRQRLGVAQALINDPELVLLDEPTDGVDPVGRRDIRNVLIEMRRRGKTVLVNSHLLGELEMVCERVAILVMGEVAQQGTLEDLAGAERWTDIEIVGTVHSEAFDQLITQHDAARIDSENGATIRVPNAEPEVIQPFIDAIRSAGGMIRSLQPHRLSLEDLFIRAVRDPETGQAMKPGAPRGRQSRRQAEGAQP